MKRDLIRSSCSWRTWMLQAISFFLTWGWSVTQKNQMACVKLSGGRLTTNQRKMKAHAYDFYPNILKAELRTTESYSKAPSPQSRGMSCSGLSADSRGADICCQSNAIQTGTRDSQPLHGFLLTVWENRWCLFLPVSCQLAVSFLLPTKGELALLKNWKATGGRWH